MTVDACVFVGTSRYGPSLSLDRVTELGADIVVATPASPVDRDLPSANRRLLADSRVAVLARVDPWEASARASAEDALAKGAVGLFLHPWEETFTVTDDALLGPYLELAADAGRPVVVDGGYPWLAEPAQLAELAVRHPRTTVVATRGGHMNMSGLSGQSALLALRRAPNLHVLTSGVYRQDWLEQVAADVGADRLLYGSLAPHLDPRLELLRPNALADTDVRARVLHDNAVRLFGLAAHG